MYGTGPFADGCLLARRLVERGVRMVQLFTGAGQPWDDHGNIKEARQYFESALRYQADNSTILIYYAAALIRTGNASQAVEYAQRAVRSAPESPDAYTMLGYAQFASDHTKEAIASWKRSLALRPDSAVQQFLSKAEREQNAEAEFSQGESAHFTLHYEGHQTSEALRAQILQALESDYDDLVRDLGTPPRDNILVTIYTEQTFFDVTHAPTWSGAMNDGKLRIPISGLSSLTPELAHVLKHELAHSFITQLSAIPRKTGTIPICKRCTQKQSGGPQAWWIPT